MTAAHALWRRAFVQAALESGTYREKLALIIDEAQSMHLSEREAAHQYGEVLAACMTLQQRVRGWIEERKRNKDHRKVTTKTAFGYSSFSRPDRRAERLRRTQRFEHEEAAIQALAFAGDFHKGTKGTNRFY